MSNRSAEQQREQYWQRKIDGLCVECGCRVLEDDGVRCADCMSRSALRNARYQRSAKGRAAARNHERRKYAANPEAKRKAMRERYERHKLAGLCTRCSEPAKEDSLLCARHHDIDRGLRAGGRVLKPRPSLRSASDRYTPFDETDPKTRLLRAMRFMDWSSSTEIFDALGLGEDWRSTERNTLQVTLRRLVTLGLVEKRNAPGRKILADYRLTASGRAEADRIRNSGLEPQRKAA